MKPGGPLKRSKPLEPGEPPQRKTGLRRTGPWQQKAGRESLDARKSSPRRKPVNVGPTGEVVEAVLERDRYSCIRCGYGIGPNERGRRWSLHHRKRRSQGVEHTVQNLILLCGGSEASGCHGWVHGNPDEAREAGWLLRGRMEPLAIPVLIPLENRRVYLGADGLYHQVREAS